MGNRLDRKFKIKWYCTMVLIIKEDTKPGIKKMNIVSISVEMFIFPRTFIKRK